jgi:hypothetical protein
MRPRPGALSSRLFASILLLAVLALGAGIAPGVASADSNNTKTINQTEVEIPGTETGTGATSGATYTQNTAIVRQNNVQVGVGDATALANSTQTATNDATVNQTSIAVAGDATSSDGTATSGNAYAKNHAVVIQLNVQVMALLSPQCVAHQTAANEAYIDQTAIAATGNATSEGGHASSGDARVHNKGAVVQKNIQVHVCKPRSPGSTTQTAYNGYGAVQGTAAVSGESTAGPGSTAASGSVEATNSFRSYQRNFQRSH